MKNNKKKIFIKHISNFIIGMSLPALLLFCVNEYIFFTIDKTIMIYPYANYMYNYFELNKITSSCDAALNEYAYLECISKIQPEDYYTIGGKCLDYSAQYCALINHYNNENNKKTMSCKIFIFPELKHASAIITIKNEAYCIADYNTLDCTKMII